VGRDFAVAAPDRLWVADMSYLRCWEGLEVLSFALDAFSRRTVGWPLAGHMRTTLVFDPLRMALGTRSPGANVALIHHGDRGSQVALASGTSNVVPGTAAVVEAAVATGRSRARGALAIVRGAVVIGAGPGVRPIDGNDDTIVSGG
jgi:hypothetical protein